jgi:hypothetical protein
MSVMGEFLRGQAAVSTRPGQYDALNAAAKQVDALAAALRTVLDLHKAATALGVAVCTVCSQVKDDDEWDDPNDDPIPSWVPFPCDTVRTIKEALNA